MTNSELLNDFLNVNFFNCLFCSNIPLFSYLTIIIPKIYHQPIQLLIVLNDTYSRLLDLNCMDEKT